MRSDIVELLEASNAWCATAGVRESTLSSYMTNRGSRLEEIRDGQYVPKASTVVRWQAWMSDHPAETWRANNPRGAAAWRGS